METYQFEEIKGRLDVIIQLLAKLNEPLEDEGAQKEEETKNNERRAVPRNAV